MFSDPQFWVAVSFIIFIAAIFNPVKKILISNLDLQIKDIKEKINESENLKNDAQITLSELKTRGNEVQKEIQELKNKSENKISELKELYAQKLSEQIEKKKLLAEDKIEQLLRDTNIIIKNQIANAAIEATRDILQNKLSNEHKSDLIVKSIKDLSGILKN